MRRLIFLPIAFVFLLMSAPSAYGHGLGFDETLPVVISGRQVSIETTLTPFYIEGVAEGRPVFTVRTFEPGTNATIAGTDFRVVVELRDKMLLDQRFTSPDGLVIANLIPEDIEIAQINGSPQSEEPVRVSENNPAEVRSRILADGGLYHISVTLETSSTGLQVDRDRTFDLYVSISKVQDFQVETEQGPETISVRTYYSDVNDFEYDAETGRIAFSMPFEWNLQYVRQVPLVHMEIEFPKIIEILQANSYAGTINGIDLAAGDVLIDDYSFAEKRVVHYVLNNPRLTNIAERTQGESMDFVLIPAVTPRFPLDLMSTTERYLWQISWSPEVIETGSPTLFVMNIQETEFGEIVRDSSFDFVLSRDGNEIFRQNLRSGIGAFSQEYIFSEPGTYRLAAQNINRQNESAYLDIIVVQGTGTAVQQPQQPSQCLIATAAFGSELTPQVQFLRGFRDNYIMQSVSGSAFMNAFNTVYYSFSPQVADYQRDQPWLQDTVKTAIYPLFGILLASEKAFTASGGDEAGTVLAGVVASSLIGAVYLAPFASAAMIASKKRISSRMLYAAILFTIAALAVSAVALQANSATILEIATSAFVISAAGAAAIAVARVFTSMWARVRARPAPRVRSWSGSR